MTVPPDDPDDPFNLSHYARVRSHSHLRTIDVPVSALLMAAIVVIFLFAFALPSQRLPGTTAANEITDTGPSPWMTPEPAIEPSNSPSSTPSPASAPKLGP
jgi:hypothetical protein